MFKVPLDKASVHTFEDFASIFKIKNMAVIRSLTQYTCFASRPKGSRFSFTHGGRSLEKRLKLTPRSGLRMYHIKSFTARIPTFFFAEITPSDTITDQVVYTSGEYAIMAQCSLFRYALRRQKGLHHFPSPLYANYIWTPRTQTLSSTQDSVAAQVTNKVCE